VGIQSQEGQAASHLSEIAVFLGGTLSLFCSITKDVAKTLFDEEKNKILGLLQAWMLESAIADNHEFDC